MKHSLSEKVLKNGISVLFIDIAGSENFDLAIAIRSGFRFSTKDDITKYEIPHILEHLVFDGSSKHTESDELQEIFSNGGGASNGMTTPYHNIFMFHNRAKNAQSVLSAGLNMVFHPLLSEKSFIEEYRVVENEIQEGLSDVAGNVAQYTMQKIIPGFLASSDTQMDRLPNVKFQDIEPYFKKYYSTNNTTVIVGADFKKVSKAQLEKIILNETSLVPKGDSFDFPIFEMPAEEPKTATYVAINKSVVDTAASLMFVKKGTPSLKETIALGLFTSITTDMKSYSLNHKLRKQGLIYGLAVEPLQSLETYGLELSVVADNKKFTDVYAYVLDGIRNFIAKGLTDKQFETARADLAEAVANESSDSSDNIMGWYVQDYLMEKTLVTAAEHVKIIKNMTQKEMIDIVSGIFRYENLYQSVFSSKPIRASTTMELLAKEILEKNSPVTEQLIMQNSMSIAGQDLAYKRFMGFALVALFGTFIVPFGTYMQQSSLSGVFMNGLTVPWNFIAPIYFGLLFVMLLVMDTKELRKSFLQMILVFVAWFAIIGISEPDKFSGTFASSDPLVRIQAICLVSILALILVGAVYGARKPIHDWFKSRKK